MPERLSPYHRRLLLFLSVATFFEGYDILVLTQVLPELRAEMGFGDTAAGSMLAVINIGTVVAYLLVRRADTWGRRRVLTWTITGYTLFTFLTGLSRDVWSFSLFQMLARVFLVGEYATSMVIAAEEFPAARRGLVIGVINGFAGLGSVVCAGIVPLLLRAPWGWRTAYFVGLVPLVLLAIARRDLRETRRFVEQVGTGTKARRALTHVWTTPYRWRVLGVGVIWFLTYVGTQNAVTFWKQFAVDERKMTPTQVGGTIMIAALVAMPLIFLAGKLIDAIGRRPGSVVIFGLTAFGVFGAYTFEGRASLTIALTFGIFGTSAVLPVLSAYTTELFPTDLRGDAYAWANNLLGRVGCVVSPLALGFVASSVGWGAAVRATAVFPVAAVVLILRLLPETRSRELEDTAAL